MCLSNWEKAGKTTLSWTVTDTQPALCSCLWSFLSSDLTSFLSASISWQRLVSCRPLTHTIMFPSLQRTFQWNPNCKHNNTLQGSLMGGKDPWLYGLCPHKASKTGTLTKPHTCFPVLYKWPLCSFSCSKGVHTNPTLLFTLVMWVRAAGPDSSDTLKFIKPTHNDVVGREEE